MTCPLAAERIWVEKSRYHDAEREYYERLSNLLKGTVNPPQTESSNLKVNSEKKNRKVYRKSISPETLTESCDIVISKTTSNICFVRPKMYKKTKAADSEGSSSNSVPNDVSPHKAQGDILETTAVEETKTRKKKRKKTNKDSREKLQDISNKETVRSTSTFETRNISLEVNEKPKVVKSKGPSSNQCTLVSEIAKARQHIKNSLEKMDGIATLAASPVSPDAMDRLTMVEKDNIDLRKLIEELKHLCIESEIRVKTLEQKFAAVNILLY